MLYINQFLYASSIFQQVEPIIILAKKGTGRKIESLLNAVGIGLELAVPRFHKGLFDGFSVWMEFLSTSTSIQVVFFWFHKKQWARVTPGEVHSQILSDLRKIALCGFPVHTFAPLICSATALTLFSTITQLFLETVMVVKGEHFPLSFP